MVWLYVRIEMSLAFCSIKTLKKSLTYFCPIQVSEIVDPNSRADENRYGLEPNFVSNNNKKCG